LLKAGQEFLIKVKTLDGETQEVNRKDRSGFVLPSDRGSQSIGDHEVKAEKIRGSSHQPEMKIECDDDTDCAQNSIAPRDSSVRI
jgi:hypothetical protein